MGFGSTSGMAPVAIRVGVPTFILTGGGGKVANTVTQSNPTFSLTVA